MADDRFHHMKGLFHGVNIRQMRISKRCSSKWRRTLQCKSRHCTGANLHEKIFVPTVAFLRSSGSGRSLSKGNKTTMGSNSSQSAKSNQRRLLERLFQVSTPPQPLSHHQCLRKREDNSLLL
jgi:hypothetical protein